MRNLQSQIENQSEKLKKPFQLACKRLFDLVVSLICLVLLSPLFIGVALCIYFEDGRPFLFKQKRSGLHDNIFAIYKFRSMKINPVESAEQKIQEKYYWENGVPDSFVFKTASLHNPNITRTGKFIRKYSLDELPQFLNVLKGEMSIIGPRPEIIDITKYYNETQKQRLMVKPGITGLAQVNGRSSMDHGEKIRHDLNYVRNFSIWMDMKICVKTIYQVILGKGSV
ncbi:sugar transferase [Virgibacillus halodenitrificans]|uniref:sugar transferase n=1 Tax=Virgibacillus halodenitrificans TaxID=1482 RepID=UPI000EF493DC|nr:sugar transferase [Virgibacillus halodenitrificans]